MKHSMTWLSVSYNVQCPDQKIQGEVGAYPIVKREQEITVQAQHATGKQKSLHLGYQQSRRSYCSGILAIILEYLNLTPHQVLNLIVLGERACIIHLFIPLSVPPSLPHNILEGLHIQFALHYGVRKRSDWL